MNEGSLPNFLGLDAEESARSNAAAAIIPCPYERTTSYLKGTESGPAAILQASEQVELFDSETGKQVCDNGIHTHPILDYQSKSEQECLDWTESVVDQFLKEDTLPIVLGGEHTISISPIRAAAKHFGRQNLSVLHFDAHSDMRNTYQGNLYSHASIMRRVHEEIGSTYSVGIRAQCQEERIYLKENAYRYGVCYDHQRAAHGLNVEEALRYLNTRYLYITIDLDYFSPETMPSVGTPVPGGGHWYETLSFIKAIVQEKHLVGADVVELKPDQDKRSDFFAAQLVYKLLTYALGK